MSLLTPELSAKQMARFCRALAMMNAGDITLLRSLELLTEGPAGRPYRDFLIPIVERLRAGDTPAAAFETQHRRFPRFFLDMVVIADRAGVLESVFGELAEAYQEQADIRAYYIRGLAYPAMVLFSAAFLIPHLGGLYYAMFRGGSVAGYLLRTTLQISVQVGSLLGTFVVLKRTGALRSGFTTIGSRVWLVRSILYDIALARFLRALSILLNAGLGPARSIERAAAVTYDARIREKLLLAVPLVQEGASLFEALQSTGLLPDMALEMVWTGEQTGALIELLDKAVQYLHDSATHRHKNAANVFVTLAIPIGITFYFSGIFVMQAWNAIRETLSW